VARWLKFCPEHECEQLLCYNLPTTPQLQEGPQCGLVALAMAGEDTQLQTVVRVAREQGYTQQGEMFSVENMAALAQTVLAREVSVRDSVELCDTRKVMSHLTSGRPLLVPYDCAPNHSPALMKGRKAHWALITGFILANRDFNLEEVKENAESWEETEAQLVLLKRTIQPDSPVLQHPASFHLIARQSKSVVLGVWEAEELVRSNNNLVEVDFKREDGEYVIPDGGIESGLCGRMVLL